MKLSQLIIRAQEALNKYGDLDINAHYCPGDNWMSMDDYDEVIDLDESRNELQLHIG